MPLPSTHLAVGLALGILAYLLDMSDPNILLVSLVGSIFPDIDIVTGHHRITPTHSLLWPIVILICSFIFRKFSRRVSSYLRWFSINYMVHIILDLFNWYVPILYPLSDSCIWVNVAPGLSTHGVYIANSVHVSACVSLPSGIPHLQDVELVPIGILVLAVLILLYLRHYYSRR